MIETCMRLRCHATPLPCGHSPAGAGSDAAWRGSSHRQGLDRVQPVNGGEAALGGGSSPPGILTWARRRRAPMRVAWMVATLRSTLVLSTLGMPCLSARRARYSCGHRGSPGAGGQGTLQAPPPSTH